MGHTMAGMRVYRVTLGYEARQLDGRVTRIPAILEQLAKGVMIGGRVTYTSAEGVTTAKRRNNAQNTGKRVRGASGDVNQQVVSLAWSFDAYPTYPRVPVSISLVPNDTNLRGVA